MAFAVEKDLGKPIEQVFKTFHRTPLKVGTVGEVSEAERLNGEKVVVKVVTPSKREAIKRMLARLEKVAEGLKAKQKRFPGTYDPMAMFHEFKVSMMEELDFRHELTNAEKIGKHLTRHISIPHYHPALSGPNILVQSFAKGMPIAAIADARIRKAALENLGNLLFAQLTKTGVFHDDLHPGNFRVEAETGAVEVLDFGRVGTQSPEQRKQLFPFLMAVKAANSGKVFEILHAMSPPGAAVDKDAVLRAFDAVLKRPHQSPSEKLSELFFEAGQKGLPVAPAYLRVLKAVMSYEGAAKAHDPSFDFTALLRNAYLRSLLP